MFHTLFLHWPFHTLPLNDYLIKSYNQALCTEISRLESSHLMSHLNAIFIGGKAPNTWPKQYILDMSGTLSTIADFDKNTEFTLEVDSRTLCNKNFALWKSIGVNRLCIKVSLEKGQQKTLARVFEIVKQAQKVFKNISLDVYIRSFLDWKKFAHIIVTLPIKHISLDIAFCKESAFIDWYTGACELFGRSGFKQYELLHFAQDGFESKYQHSYWDRKPSKGCGNGAWSFNGKTRFQNETNLMSYIAKIKNGKDPVTFSETLNAKEIFLEKLMSGLRKTSGIRLSSLLPHLTKKEQKHFFNKLTHLKNERYVTENNENISFTLKGLMIEQHIITTLTC